MEFIKIPMKYSYIRQESIITIVTQNFIRIKKEILNFLFKPVSNYINKVYSGRIRKYRLN